MFLLFDLFKAFDQSRVELRTSWNMVLIVDDNSGIVAHVRNGLY